MAGRPRYRAGVPLVASVSMSILVLALVAGAIFFLRQNRDSHPTANSWQGALDDPRLTFPTPYRNTAPDVAYVKDSTCAQCHADEAEAFHKHPMGRSMAPVAKVAAAQRYDPAVHNPFEALGALFGVEHKDGRIWHTETRRGPGGDIIARAAQEVQFVLGSGTHSYSYVIDHSGALVQSPITFYSQKGVWDLSPGYAVLSGPAFERRVTTGCLFCHANRASPVVNTLNRYQAPIFPEGASIGCQRCHGPGSLHLARRERGEVVDGLDDTIVNPRRLPSELRDGICQQCHLEGAKRILKRGREYFDYRPGLPWQMFWTVFVRSDSLADNKFDSSVEQLSSSRCFQSSKGRMGCTTCHDAHAMPEPEARVGYYRRRCLQCHETTAACSLPLEARREKSKQDDCRVCHMPAFSSSDIPHTAATDHRIPRRPDGTAAALPQGPGSMPLRPFLADVEGYRGGEADRALGMALVEMAKARAEDMGLARVALPLLADADRYPNDFPALEARAEALALLGQPGAALSICEAILARAPKRETALENAAALAEVLGMQTTSLSYRRRLLEVNPSSLHYRIGLAEALAKSGDRQELLSQCKTILQQYPPDVAGRRLLVRYYLGQRDGANARNEFAKLLALDPPHAEQLRRWFAAQSR